jgi:hypothetical protein
MPAQRVTTSSFALILALLFLLAGPLQAEPFTLQQTWTGEVIGDQFSFAAAPVGDIDGDGFGDLAVGANVNDDLIQSGGKVYVYRGGAEYPTTPSLQYAGDLHRGYVGGAVAGGADLNGDGFDDWAVGAPGLGTDGLQPGQVYVFFGGQVPDAVPDLVLAGTVAGGQFGGAVCLIPDWDGDGYGDLAVGNPRAGDGEVAIYRGGIGGPGVTPDVVIHARADDLRFGKSLTFLPDRDGDGRDELLVGVPRSSEAVTWAGAVLLFAGSANLDTIPDLVFLGENAGDEFGYHLSAAGDADGDGVKDILVGAPFANAGGVTDAGRSYLFSGGANLDTVADLILSGVGFEERFGTSVSLGFDWNGDGWGDIAAGAPDRNTGGQYSGGVDIFFGGALLDTLPDVVVAGSEPDLHLGTTVVNGGDLLGSGTTTLCLGGYNAVNEGEIRLYGREPDPISSAPLDTPSAFRLLSPWPNPANPRVQFALDLQVAGHYRVRILDLAGRSVADLHDGSLLGGRTTWTWDGTDSRGLAVASGVYLVRAESGSEVESRRFSLVR